MRISFSTRETSSRIFQQSEQMETPDRFSRKHFLQYIFCKIWIKIVHIPYAHAISYSLETLSFLPFLPFFISDIYTLIFQAFEIRLIWRRHTLIFTEKTLLILKFYDFFQDFIDIIGCIVYLKTTKRTKHSLIFDDTITVLIANSCLLE